MRKIEAGKPIGDLPIGEKFEYEGRKGTIVVKKSFECDVPDCFRCAFGYGEMDCLLLDNDIKPFCVGSSRKDGTDIYYEPQK